MSATGNDGGGGGGEGDSNLVGTSFSLVRYNNPVLIDKKQDEAGAGAVSPSPGAVGGAR